MPKRASPADRRITASGRTRAYAACTECRRRKRKCDGETPCSSCRNYGYHCSLVPAGEGTSSGGRPASLDGAAVQAVVPPPSICPEEVVASKERGRLINAHSAVAYPYLVGRGLDASEPPRLHSYAWNLGLQHQVRGSIDTRLSQYITLEECRELSTVYFNTVHSFFPFLRQNHFLMRMENNWLALEQSSLNFAAVVAGVVALASFFSTPRHSQEENLKRHCVSIIDLSFSQPASAIDMDSVSGQILWTLYARLTTRPAVSCLASHTAMHKAEIMGLHALVSDPNVSTLAERTGLDSEEVKERRRHYWAASFLDHLLSIEYGMTPVALAVESGSRSTADGESPSEDILSSLTKVLCSVRKGPKHSAHEQTVDDGFHQLAQMTNLSPVACLFRAEVCLCLLRQSPITLAGRNTNPACISILQKALQIVPELLSAKQPWWCLPSVPFQTVCVCLAADTPQYLSLLPESMGALRAIVNTFDSHMTREALQTAQKLIEASRENTVSKLSFKSSALEESPTAENAEVPWLCNNQHLNPLETWPLDLDFIPYFDSGS